jgi:hypothetical protein
MLKYDIGCRPWEGTFDVDQVVSNRFQVVEYLVKTHLNLLPRLSERGLITSWRLERV